MGIWDLLARRGQDLLKQAVAHLELKLPSEPLPQSWRPIIDENVPLARTLTNADKDRLLRVARLLLNEVPFEGCGGLEIDEEIRVTVAATAALLIHRLPYPRFTKLVRVLVYPDIFLPAYARSLEDTAPDEPKPHVGQAWRDGIVVLAWSEIQPDASRPLRDGNVVLHEMAHILDGEDGRFDGTPLLDDPGQGPAWAAVLTREFDHHREAVDADDDAALNDYAATNRAEFFAVATESFFCTPARLRDRLPDLYEQLRRFYRQDPLATPAPDEPRPSEPGSARTDQT